ncbi:MAG: hypothetical protein LBM61_08235 [Prevotellaceae bacterium]|nr:hypothetical protein [Prevotellaceae bacterium]
MRRGGRSRNALFCDGHTCRKYDGMDTRKRRAGHIPA